MNPLDRLSIPLTSSRPVRARLALSTIAACVALLGAAWPARAQDGAVPAQPSPGGNLPEVTVTGAPVGGLGLSLPSTSGSRTGIATQELPASLDSVDSETWQERGDSKMADIVGRTVGLTPLNPTGYSSLTFSSRGFTGSTAVGIAEDGERVLEVGGTIRHPDSGWGYERVEVLRGLASIVYGSGTVGGTVNAIRKQPSRHPVREVMVSGGNYDTAKVGVGAAGPIGDLLSYRVDAYGDYSAGERSFSRSNSRKLMTTLRIQPNSLFNIDLLADVSDANPTRYSGSPSLNGRIVPALRDQNYNVADGVLYFRDQNFRARAKWVPNDWVTVRNSLYYNKMHRSWKNIENFRYNTDDETVLRSSFLEIMYDVEQIGNRFETSFKLDHHTLVAGLDVSRANSPRKSNPERPTSTVSAINPEQGYWGMYVHGPMQEQNRTKLTTTSLYLEDAWRLSDRWLLLSGIRHESNDLSRHEFSDDSRFGSKLSDISWRLGLSYKLNGNTNLYAQVSRGHDPVGSILNMSLANSRYKLTKTRQLEIGLKQQFGQGIGEWTAALYRIEKDDIITRDPNDPTISIQGGRQHAQGLELTASVRPTKNWRLDGNYAFTDARFDELVESDGRNNHGNRPANVSRHTANLWAHYQTHNRHGVWRASLGTRLVGRRYGDNANTVSSAGFGVWDAVLSWRPAGNITLGLSVRNIGNKLYTYSAVSGNQVRIADRRRIDLTAEFLF